ncbi:hypothetical protein RHGRI_011774 [Rhododendron griersonianum]|uniref:No apical meristem-associated C-terminal domain-containing protein n=1 Tax=Rhododendron griersonianum TaxID=479676 RepID=A0AAV6KNN7_9ERIC|nr:hypothetical protein RHGRI_011774 [Rhododendron griersonianum]
MEHIATTDPYSFSLILSLPSLYLITEELVKLLALEKDYHLLGYYLSQGDHSYRANVLKYVSKCRNVRMDSLQDPFFSNLIHYGSNLDNQFMESQEAKIMYQDLDVKHTAFQFEHCWDVLKHQPKWFQECEKKKPKRGRIVATPLAELVNPEKDVADDIIEVEGSIVNKIAKEQRKKNKINDHAIAPIVQVLNELKEEKKTANEKKHQMLQISYGLQVEKLKME